MAIAMVSPLWNHPAELSFVAFLMVTLTLLLFRRFATWPRLMMERSLRRWASLEGCKLLRWSEPVPSREFDRLLLRGVFVTVVDGKHQVRKACIRCDERGGIWSFEWVWTDMPLRRRRSAEGVWKGFTPAAADATTQGKLLGRKRSLDLSTWITRQPDAGPGALKPKPMSPGLDPLERLLERKRSLHLSEPVAATPPAGSPLLWDDWLDS